MELIGFCVSVKDAYPLPNDKVLGILISFTTSNLFEVEFSTVTVVKSKYLAKIDVEQEVCPV